jgi:tetratricopeptide (TPR) repeat protein
MDKGNWHRGQIRREWRMILLTVSVLLLAGCAQAVYQADFNTNERPQMSLSQATEVINKDLQGQIFSTVDVRVTKQGFSFKNEGITYSSQFNDLQGLVVSQDGNFYCISISNFTLQWNSRDAAQSFVDAVMAIKYYGSSQYLADEATAFSDLQKKESAAFAEFQEKAKVWLALPQKPSLPEEARRFRVLAEDATESKDFEKAVGYYEQGLAIEPMWPVGHYNAALIYGELKNYNMAVIHMKRFLVLKPDAKEAQTYRDKIYIWEEKAKESKASSEDNLSSQPAANK